MPQTLQATNSIDSITISPDNLDILLEKEWLLSNARGSYASGTVIGCNTRRYHGLLIASLHPPVERVVTLSNLLETVHINGKTFELSNFEFSDRIHPQGYRFLKQFRYDNGVHFTYQIGDTEIVKSIYLDYDQDLLNISYTVSGDETIQFSLMPLLALRDFHSLQSSSMPLSVKENNGIVSAYGLDPHGPAVHMYCQDATFEQGADWWYSMRYRTEARRGQHDYEDVWAPGVFQTTIDSCRTITLNISATRGLQRPGPLDIDPSQTIQKLRKRQGQLNSIAKATDEIEQKLINAADQLIVRRRTNETQVSTSILAGFHWFADWGRDTFIALPGLLLSTRRFDEALEVLTTFGSVLDQGQIPNRFDDYGGEPHYNSVDASLWFINAAYQYLLATDDKQTFNKTLRPMIVQITDAYRSGTRDNIHADDDGLISSGDENTQLTWMDAKCNGVAFTPRFGKAVEINALWYNALNILAVTTTNSKQRKKYLKEAEQVKTSFCNLFWNEKNNCLNDGVFPDGTTDAAIRPNQIFAVSLPFSCLDSDQQKSVVQIVKDQLLTPYGLRSLSPKDSRYQGFYGGDQFQRDSAYHQGTVWSFLMEPFIESFLKVNDNSEPARLQAKEFVAPLLQHFASDGCLGSVSEIFDGDYPHRPKGCIAQAWGIAALIRCYKLTSNN